MIGYSTFRSYNLWEYWKSLKRHLGALAIAGGEEAAEEEGEGILCRGKQLKSNTRCHVPIPNDDHQRIAGQESSKRIYNWIVAGADEEVFQARASMASGPHQVRRIDSCSRVEGDQPTAVITILTRATP